MSTATAKHFKARPRTGWLGRAARAVVASLIVTSGVAAVHGAGAASVLASLSGQVTGTGGAGVPGVTVVIEVVDCAGAIPLTTTTDASGNYAFTASVAAGTYAMSLRPPAGSYPSPQFYPNTVSITTTPGTFTVAPGQNVTGINDQLVSGGTISGLVSAAGGAPLGGISVSVAPVDSSGNLSANAEFATTAADGTWAVTGAVPGLHAVLFQDSVGS